MTKQIPAQEITLSLQKEYQYWLLSRRIKDALQALPAFRQMDTPSLEAALENVLMQELLASFTDQDNLWDSVQVKSLQIGFAEVEEQLTTIQAQEALSQIEKTRQEFLGDTVPHTAPPTIRIADDSFYGGEFALPRIAPVEKAFTHLRKQNSEDTAAALLLRSALRYASLYSKTRHIGPPQKVYDYFYEWGVRNEGFASPFNARLLGKSAAQFHSLFADTDACMGSGGSFFNLETPENPGHWCLDPPFLSSTMNQVDAIIGHWRKAYPHKALLYIIPQSHTPAVTPDETVVLKADTHYYEGLDNALHPLPVNVAIHRYGALPGFSAEMIEEGYKN